MRKYREWKAQTQSSIIPSPISQHPPLPLAPIAYQSPVLPVDNALQLDLKSWPRRCMFTNKACSRRLSILKSAYDAIRRKVSVRKGKTEHRPTGLWFKYHYQVYLFLKLQLQNEGKALKRPDLFTGVARSLVSCKGLAQKVVDGGGWGQKVRTRIMNHEVS